MPQNAIPIPIKVYIPSFGNKDLASSEIRQVAQEYDRQNPLPEEARHHSLVIHPSVNVETVRPETLRELEQLVNKLISDKQAHLNLNTFRRIKNLLEQPEYWPIIYSIAFQRSREEFEQIGKIMASMMSRTMPKFLPPEFCHRILRFSLHSLDTFIISLSMLASVFQALCPEISVTALWDQDEVRLLQGVPFGGEVVEEFPLAWKFIPQIWPTPNSDLVSFSEMFQDKASFKISRASLFDFAKSRWSQLQNLIEQADKIPAFKHFVESPVLLAINISELEFLGTDSIELIFPDQHREDATLLFFVVRQSSSSGDNAHASFILSDPQFWEEGDAIDEHVVETYALCLILDVLNGKVPVSNTEEVKHPYYDNHAFESHVGQFEMLFGTAMPGSLRIASVKNGP